MQAFTLSVILIHSVVVATVCSPVSWDVIITSVLLIYASLGEMVQPMDNFESESASSSGHSSHAAAPGGIAALASQANMFRAFVCMLALGYVLLHIPLDQQSCKSQLVLLLACLDGFMLYGHMWDRVPTLQIVLNCRVLYMCMLALYNAAMFLTWRDCTAVGFL